MVSMPSKISDPKEGSATAQQPIGKTPAKEKEAQNAATPRKPRKESSVPRPSQDAELRDYVRSSCECSDFLRHLLTTCSNWETVLGKEPLARSFER